MFKYILPAEYSEVIEIVEIELTKDGNTEEVLKVSDNLATKKGDYEFNCIKLDKVNEDNFYQVYKYKKETNSIGITKYTFVPKEGAKFYIPSEMMEDK